jgi:hypothetical protein
MTSADFYMPKDLKTSEFFAYVESLNWEYTTIEDTFEVVQDSSFLIIFTNSCVYSLAYKDNRNLLCGNY